MAYDSSFQPYSVEHKKAMFDMDFHNLLVSLPLLATLTIIVGEPSTIVVGLFFSLSIIWVWQNKSISHKLPPGHFVWPIIRNIHQLELFVHYALKGLIDKHGSILFLCSSFFYTVVISFSNITK